MQEKGNKTNLIIVAVIILVIAVAGYFYATRDQSAAEDSLLVGELSGSSAVVDTSLISALSSLKRIRLDGAVFQSPAWATLVDFSKDIAPQPSGRPNPFAPFSGPVTP